VNRVCVFCGAAAGARPEYAQAARALASELRRRGLGLVYGGGSTGLMGAVAEAALAAGVEVIGVLPHSLSGREFAHHGLTELRLVASMHERKATMASLADAFISLPTSPRLSSSPTRHHTSSTSSRAGTLRRLLARGSPPRRPRPRRARRAAEPAKIPLE
jgi:hypothetical protein